MGEKAGASGEALLSILGNDLFSVVVSSILVCSSSLKLSGPSAVISLSWPYIVTVRSYTYVIYV